MASHEIDNESLQGVNSLRSRFEQLSQESTLLLPEAPRPRTMSSSGTSPPTQTHHIRNSSSSSDLPSLKRPPPPPPPARGSRAASPIIIAVTKESDHVELLEPLDTPIVNISNLKVKFSSGTSPSNPPSPLQRSVVVPPPRRHSTSPEVPPPSVTSLRNRFSNGTTPNHSPQPSWSSSSSDIPPSISSSRIKPAVPPRPSSTILSPHETFQSPPLDLNDSTSFTSSTSSIISTHTPPAIPPRRPYYDTSGTPAASDTDLQLPPAPPALRISPKIPPPRPPRHRLVTAGDFPPAQSPNSVPPPPLPLRKGAVFPTEEDLIRSNGPATPPPLPERPGSSNSSPVDIRIGLGKGKIPPPPTRTIAIGDKLPARRTAVEDMDDDSSEDEDESIMLFPGAKIDLLPDTSRSSRRPPYMSFRNGHTPKVPIHPYSGAFVTAGSIIVVGTNHHLKVFDLTRSVDSPILVKDNKFLSGNGKDVKITSMELKVDQFAGVDNGGSGELVIWIGTKEGHLIELDVKNGMVVTGSKYSAHVHAVTTIWRYRGQMISVDSEAGKCLIFGKNEKTGRVEVTNTPKVVKIAEKQDFVNLIGGKVWTAVRGDVHGSEGSIERRVPIIRIFDIFGNGSQRSLLPSEHVGPVIAACLIPANPDTLYMGHEGGFVSIWDLESEEDGYPRCVETMKVSASDVLCMEGVNDRLWIGNRMGSISAYDVSQKPWVMTNSWKAHPNAPVVGIRVDVGGLVQDVGQGGGRLDVVSWGRDDLLRIWDGLLEIDWIDTQLLDEEESFSTFRDLKALIISWNVDSARPESLTGDPANLSFLTDALKSTSNPDIIVFGLQEVVDLENRKLAAKNVILGGIRKAGGANKDDLAYGSGAFDEKVTGAYKRWHEALLLAVRLAMPPDCPYVVVHMEGLVGLFTCIFVKKTERMTFKDLSVETVKRGMGGRYGNKGAILARFVIEDSSLCFVNCHLAAGQNGVRQRNADVASILEATKLSATMDEALAYVGGGDGTMVLDHEIVFVSGDMNYRIDARREVIVSAIHDADFDSLHINDQLLREMKVNRGFRFRGFSEGRLDFAPTYKYDRRMDSYDSSEKRRSPAWCDRVLWRSLDSNRIKQEHYIRYEANVSDHRPISAAFTVTVKKVRQDIRHQVKGELQNLWVVEQVRLLQLSRSFYVGQYII